MISQEKELSINQAQNRMRKSWKFTNDNLRSKIFGKDLFFRYGKYHFEPLLLLITMTGRLIFALHPGFVVKR